MKKQFSRRRRSHKEPKEFDEEVIQIDRVTRVVKGGRRLRFRALVVIGNRKGKVGVGIGKATEVSSAIQKGVAAAKKDMLVVPTNGTTIPHEVKTKFKSSQLLLMPAGKGTGIIAGGPVRKLLALAGVKDVLGKSFGSNNKLNVTKAAFKALQELQEVPGQKKKAPVKPVAKKEKSAAPKAKVPVKATKTPAKKKETKKTTPTKTAEAKK